MDYKDIAKAVKRSPQTVRKWCPKITALSGYNFKFKVVKRRDGERKIPNFTKADLNKFIAFKKELTSTNNFEQSVFKVYGNLKAEREREIFNEIDEVDQTSYDRFLSLSKKVKKLEEKNTKLTLRVWELEQFNSRLEKLEIGLRKKTIKDLLND